MNRGLQNCNPLNIRRVAGTRWKGSLPPSPEEGGFVSFSAMEWGLRAAFCILRTYARRYNAVCVRDIVRRWAPPYENKTEQYIKNICHWTGFGGQQRLAEADWPVLVKAMARQECGIALNDGLIVRGYALYKLI